VQGLVYALFLCSPVVMLAIERGNNDVVIFCVLVAALSLLRRSGRSRTLAYAAILVASFLKFYPVVAISSALKEKPRHALLIIAAGAGAFLLYLAFTWRDVSLITSTVPRDYVMSYGRSVLFIAFEGRDHMPHGASGFAALLVCVCAYVIAQFRPGTEAAASTHLEAFRMGASIYAGTFLLGTNWDYRLVFLILVVPQLLEWIATGGKWPLPIAVLGGLVFTMWSSFVLHWVAATARPVIFVLEELTNWALLCALLVLMLQTLPLWLKARVFTAGLRAPMPAAL
jgi:hypothetical protein